MARSPIDRIKYSDIYVDNGAFYFEAGMAIDADGAYRAYHPNNTPGLDYLGNAGKPGNWWALVTRNGKPTGKPIIQDANDPAPGYYISQTSLQDKDFDRTNPRRYVDSESVPFIVLPNRPSVKARLADYAVAVRPPERKIVGAIFADGGPAGKIGEGSIALAKALGVPSSPKSGGVGHGIVYVVFRDSRKPWPRDLDSIQTDALELFNDWGGLDKLMADLPHLNW